MPHSTGYTLRFSVMVSLVASMAVAGTSVILRGRVETNRLLDRRHRILEVGGLISADEALARDTIAARFTRFIRPVAVDLQTGRTASDVDPLVFDQRAATRDPARSRVIAENPAQVRRLPENAIVYHVMQDDTVRALILPIEGQGLWSTIYGFIALSADLKLVQGISFYEHAETPGLGGEIDERSWRAQWSGKVPFDDQWTPQLEVAKGQSPQGGAQRYTVDGLAGATLTGRAVTHLVQFWLGEEGFGAYLERYRREAGVS